MVRHYPFAPDRGWWPWFGVTGAPRIAGHGAVRARSRLAAMVRISGAPRIGGHGPLHPDPGRAEPCSAAFRYGLAMASSRRRKAVRRPTDALPVGRHPVADGCRAGARLPSMARHYPFAPDRGCWAWFGTTGAPWIAGHDAVRAGSRLAAVVRHYRCAPDWRPWCGARQIAVGGRGPHFPCAPDWRPWCGARRIAVGGHGSAFPVHPGLAAMVRCAPDRGWRPWFGITGAPRIAGHGPVHPDPGRAEPCSAAFRRGIAMA